MNKDYDVDQLCEDYHNWELTTNEIAAKYGVSRTTVVNTVMGSHHPDPDYQPPTEEERKKRARHIRRKRGNQPTPIDDQQRQRIFAIHQEGWSASTIAQRLGLSERAIKRVLSE
jgi:DNA-binding transcriptional regulator LsrR (DeoR family)